MAQLTVNGVTTTQAPGQEQYSTFSRSLGSTRGRSRGKTFYQYDYRHTDGELFTCVKPTLDACREARDTWLKAKEA